MTEKADALKKRTKQFALDVLRFVRSLPATDEASDIGGQLRRAATSVGANYRSTCRARSRAEFVSRINVTLDEADESAFWLEVLVEGEITRDARALALLDEANQLSAILTASSITASTGHGRATSNPLVQRP